MLWNCILKNTVNSSNTHTYAKSYNKYEGLPYDTQKNTGIPEIKIYIQGENDMRLKNILAGVLAGFVLAGTEISYTSYADETDMISKDTVISELWEENWNGRGDDGVIFPEASYKRHILEKWVEDNYGDDNYSWYDIGQIKYSYADYYRDLVSEWDFDDDEDGNWFITTPEHKYSFRLISGKWNMIDENGDTADMFMPFSTLEEDEIPVASFLFIDDDGEDSPRVVGQPAKAESEN